MKKNHTQSIIRCKGTQHAALRVASVHTYLYAPVETLRATSPTHHINPRAKQSPVGTQGPCVRRYAWVGTQRIEFPSGHAYATGVQRCETGADVRTVRPYKPHPSHAVLFYTASMEETVGDCASTPAMTREITATHVETSHCGVSTIQHLAQTQGCIKRKRVLLPCPAGLDPASHPVKMVGTQPVAFPSGYAYATGMQRCDTGADVRTVRPYKPHPSHAVLFDTASMAGTVGDCASTPAMTREVTATHVETSHCGVSTIQHLAQTQGCIKRKRVLPPYPAGLDPASLHRA